jgi:hypothetical protein
MAEDLKLQDLKFCKPRRRFLGFAFKKTIGTASGGWAETGGLGNRWSEKVVVAWWPVVKRESRVTK